WMTPDQLVDWAKASLNIMKLNTDMSDDDIRRAIHWVGDCSVDTIYLDGEKTRHGRIGINNMLLVTLLEFPDYYMQYELIQRN
ncbi:hypothetical protein ACFLWZ_08510, partial [Chloroflexota bacterium]